MVSAELMALCTIRAGLNAALVAVGVCVPERLKNCGAFIFIAASASESCGTFIKDCGVNSGSGIVMVFCGVCCGVVSLPGAACEFFKSAIVDSIIFAAVLIFWFKLSAMIFCAASGVMGVQVTGRPISGGGGGGISRAGLIATSTGV